MGINLRPIVLLFSVSLALTGCVTTDSRPVNENRAVVDYMNLAKGYLQEGFSEKAIRPLERALEIEPYSAGVHGMLGMAYQRQGEDQLAEQAFSKALAIDPEASEIRNNFGAFLFTRNRLKDAYRQFELASQDVAYSRRSRTFENLGIVALRMGQSSVAVDHFTRALRLNSNLPRANLELATIYKDQGNLYAGWQHYLAFDVAGEHNARSLLLGIELATANQAQGKAASYASRLERLYPGSKELKLYRSRLGHE
ncbi:type IV pilus biogenesis/stability protein PilW [Endozoicomonas sp. ONNA2]|uniref:type IV pilus biogenesis/stability protein PilW n=1 Tax=Endozoicomonas sp. ONNA2 TaxID=2828741 RepID=UPI002148EAB8|nr:type IV pilus biogenesis/stability protein PilW [Endozoicomonas sp. ONNA2]